MPWPVTRKSLPIFVSAQFLFWRFREKIKFWFTKRLSTTIILVGIISGSNKKTIGIPREGDASFVVFFGVLANENWKVASQACHFHQLPLLSEFNTLKFCMNKFFSFFFQFQWLNKIFFLGESTRTCWSYDWKCARRCWCSYGVSFCS
jgi:hypothetical protein